MHVVLTILGGVLLLGVFLLFGRQWGASAPAVVLAAKAFIPVWLMMAVTNMLVGVYHAGYSYRAELPILGVVFIAPVALAALAIWYFSKA